MSGVPVSVLLRASEIAKRPVVTFAGDDVAQVKDIVYVASGGEVGGFTLAGRGMFAGPLKTGLPWASVAGLGPDAVMVPDEDALVPVGAVVDGASSTAANASRGDVLGSQVLTDSGTALGAVVDVIIEVTGQASTGGRADVVGYEIQPVERRSARLLIPLPVTLAASGEHLIVPASATDFVRDDLAGFGAAVTEFRAQLGRTA